jgi:hypothetical protein
MTVGARPIAVNLSTGVLSYDGSVASGSPAPTQQGLIGWAFDPAVVSSNSNAYTAGVLYLVRVIPAADATVTQLGISLFGGGTTPANCFLGLYNASGTLLSGMANQAAGWATSGDKFGTLTTPQNVTAGQELYVGILVGSAVANPALFIGVWASVNNVADTAAPYRWSYTGAGLTALPASVAMGSVTASSLSLWAGMA